MGDLESFAGEAGDNTITLRRVYNDLRTLINRAGSRFRGSVGREFRDASRRFTTIPRGVSAEEINERIGDIAEIARRAGRAFDARGGEAEEEKAEEE